jgi:hypothetical protein
LPAKTASVKASASVVTPMPTAPTGQHKVETLPSEPVAVAVNPLAVAVPLKRSASPVLQVQSLNLFNIKQSLGESNEIAEAPQQSLKRPSQHFSQIDLEKEWQLFLAQLKTKDTFQHMLIQNVLLTKQDENLVEVEVASEVIQQEFLQIKTEFFNHFAHKVNNHCIEINFKFNETLMVETPNKRKLFDKFAQLNPTLLDLDKFLKLDFS